jgi:hypothetical protein
MRTNQMSVTLPELACILALVSKGAVLPPLSSGLVAKIYNASPSRPCDANEAGRRLLCTSTEVQELDMFFRKLADHFSLRGDNPTAAICIQAAENARRAVDEGGMSS